MQKRDHSQKTTRRGFVRTAGAVSAGSYLGDVSTPVRASEAPRKSEALAMNGGPKVVTADVAAAAKWPLYGDEEGPQVAAHAREVHGVELNDTLIDYALTTVRET